MNYLASMQNAVLANEKLFSLHKNTINYSIETIRKTSNSKSLHESTTIATTYAESIESESELSESYRSSSDESDCFGLSILQLASKMNNMDEKILLNKHGFTREDKNEIISKTSQGEIFLAYNCNSENNEFVAIKKIAKDLTHKKEIIKNGFTFITDKNIVNEGIVLQHINSKQHKTNKSIIKFVDAFESDEHYYLVEEYMHDSITLKEFVTKSYEYITNGQLKLKNYRKCMKSILWQLAQTLDALHNIYNCCHLDICTENVLLYYADFFQNSDNLVTINPSIRLQLIDFGVSERFESHNQTFGCCKQFLSINNQQYECPDLSECETDNNNYYDARGIDMWDYGMLMYYCYLFEYPYETMEFTEDEKPELGSGYWAVLNGKLKDHLGMQNKLKFINPKIMNLINSLLNVDSKNRFNSTQVLNHRLFAKY